MAYLLSDGVYHDSCRIIIFNEATSNMHTDRTLYDAQFQM